MKNKIVYIIIFVIFLIGCTNIREDDGEGFGVSKKKVNLTNIANEDIEENINGYNIVQDERITDNTADGNKKRLPQFNQRLNAQVLNTDSNDSHMVLEEYQSILPKGIRDEVSYTYYDIGYTYYLVTKDEGAEVKEQPSADGTTIGHLNYLDKVSLLQSIQGETHSDSDIWYNVLFLEENELKPGYIHSSSGVLRRYRFDEMQDAVQELINELEGGALSYIRNYKNINGDPPKKGDAFVDAYGYRSYHSAPAYLEPSTNSDFRYIPDGMLVRILEEMDDLYHIDVPTFGSDFYVPKNYIDTNETLNQLKHVIVVDRSQQNQAAFEISNDELNLISYTLSTTGVTGERSYETTLGSYKTMEKKDSFYYLGSGAQGIAGYAPYAIRFTGGAYIHGVPVAYVTQNGETQDPGLNEYLHTIGTLPRSSMCVRNYTSHAEFLYNWMDIDNGAVIVIE